MRAPRRPRRDGSRATVALVHRRAPRAPASCASTRQRTAARPPSLTTATRLTSAAEPTGAAGHLAEAAAVLEAAHRAAERRTGSFVVSPPPPGRMRPAGASRVGGFASTKASSQRGQIGFAAGRG